MGFCPSNETFAQARFRIFAGLRLHAWEVHDELKTPWAEPKKPNFPEFRLWFKPQAVYIGPYGCAFGAARSLFCDIRDASTAYLIAWACLHQDCEPIAEWTMRPRFLGDMFGAKFFAEIQRELGELRKANQ